MKKLLFLFITLLLFSCSTEDASKELCNCNEEVSYYYIDNGTISPGDVFTYPIENPNCELNGQSYTQDTPFNGGIVRKVTIIVCE